jgi:hypothetical protein
MTVEKILFVSPEDILAVRIECAACGLATIIPVSKLGRLSTMLEGQCICGQNDGLGKGTRELQEVALFGTTLGNLAANLKGRKTKLSLQIGNLDGHDIL